MGRHYGREIQELTLRDSITRLDTGKKVTECTVLCPWCMAWEERALLAGEENGRDPRAGCSVLVLFKHAPASF